MLPSLMTEVGPLSLLVVALAVSAAGGQGPAPPSPTPPAQAAPAYPRVNLATAYEVDPNWPQRAPDVHWAAVPGIAVDPQDNVWIFTRTNPTVQVYAPDGRYRFGWGSDHTNTIAHFIKIDRAGNVWVADVGRHIVRQHSPAGNALLTLGTEGEPGEDARHFNKPTDMAIGPNGDIFVADGYGNNRVVRFDARGQFIQAWGRLGSAPGQFSIPHAIACDSQGRVYVADRNNVRVQVFNAKGRLLDVWQNVLVPWGIWVSPHDEIWVCGSSPMTWRTDPKYPAAPLGCPPKDQLFVKFNPAGRVLQLWTLPKGEDGREKPGELNWLHAIALDSKGNVYLGDIIGQRVQKFVPQR
jgi:DNA-binding beta-propeller fold protein YncE